MSLGLGRALLALGGGLGEFAQKKTREQELAAERAREDTRYQQQVRWHDEDTARQTARDRQEENRFILGLGLKGYGVVKPGDDEVAEIREANAQIQQPVPVPVRLGGPLPSLGKALRANMPTVQYGDVALRYNPAGDQERVSKLEDYERQRRDALEADERNYRQSVSLAETNARLARQNARFAHDLENGSNPLGAAGKGLEQTSDAVERLVALHGGNAQAALNYATRTDQPRTREMVRSGKLTPAMFDAAAQRERIKTTGKKGAAPQDVQAALDALDNYQRLTNDFMRGGWGHRVIASMGGPAGGAQVGALEAAQKAALLRIKDLAELGALQEGDLRLMTGLIGDPTSLRALLRDPKYTTSKLGEARKYLLQSVGKNSRTADDFLSQYR